MHRFQAMILISLFSAALALALPGASAAAPLNYDTYAELLQKPRAGRRGGLCGVQKG